MAFCETCGVNVVKKRLRECVFRGHKIVWGYYKRGAPTEKIPTKNIEKIEEMKKIAEQIAQFMPPEKIKEIEEMKKEIEQEFEALLCTTKKQRRIGGEKCCD